MSPARSFFRRHYTGIMLSVIVVSVSGSLILLAFQNAQLNIQAERSTEQIRLLKGIAEEISADQQKQHNHQDERQACFFNLFVSYTNNRKPVTQEDTNRCRVTGVEGTPDVYTQSSQESSDSQTSPAAPAEANDASARREPDNPTPETQEVCDVDTVLFVPIKLNCRQESIN